MITFTPSKEFKIWYKKLYGLEAKEIRLSDDKVYNLYLDLLESMINPKQPWYQRIPVLRCWIKWIKQLFNLWR